MVDRKRILVIGTSYGGGDVPPLLALVTGLVNRGNDVLFVGDQSLVDLTRGSGLSVRPVPAGLDMLQYHSDWRQMVEGSAESRTPRLFSFDWGDAVFAKLSRDISGFRADAVVCNARTLYLGAIVREKLGAALCYLNVTCYFGPGARRTLEQDYATTNSIPFIEGVLPFYEQIDLAIHATDAQFDPPPDPRPTSHHWVGPLLWEPQIERPQFLDVPGDAWALVSLSLTRQAGEQHLAQITMNALRDRPVRTLLTLADERAEDEFDSIPPNARIERYVRHSEVLGQAALSISHGGHGIVSKSMYYGVPMVLVPMGRDQPGVAARAEALGIARVVHRGELSEVSMRTAIADVLENPKYLKNARAHGARLQAQDSVVTACAFIEAL